MAREQWRGSMFDEKKKRRSKEHKKTEKEEGDVEKWSKVLGAGLEMRNAKAKPRAALEMLSLRHKSLGSVCVRRTPRRTSKPGARDSSARR